MEGILKGFLKGKTKALKNVQSCSRPRKTKILTTGIQKVF
jgi:hypothetical protein